MKKIAIIIQRYGEEVSGGGEFYARSLAAHLKQSYEVTVLTTTSLDLTFSKHYEAGETLEDGVRVIRFDNDHARNFPRMEELNNDEILTLEDGRSTRLGVDLQWSNEWGPYCPRLVRYVEASRDRYDAFILFTYIYSTTVRCLPLVRDKAIFIPTAHDEVWGKLTIFQKLFQMPRYLGFLTKGEEDFVRSFYKNRKVPGEIIGCGVDLPKTMDAASFRKDHGLRDDYIVYVGRVDTSKSCDELVRYFLKYKRKDRTGLKLVLVGQGDLPDPKHKDIIFTGFLTEQEKFDCISGALAMVAPSKYESLCIAVLEGFSCGIPLLANGECKILEAHCQQGKTGLCYRSEAGFIEKLRSLVEDPQMRREMGAAAVEYMRSTYTWDIVVGKIDKMVDAIAADRGGRRHSGGDPAADFRIRNVFLDGQFSNEVIYANKDTLIEPAFRESGAVAVCLTSSNYFAPISAVAVSSLIQNASPDRRYDILILTNDMSDQNRKRIGELATENCSIRFVRFEDGAFAADIATHDSYNIYTYYRLMIPSICLKYEKVLYLDSDMVIDRDVAELFDVDLDGYYAAAALDLTILTWQVMKERHPLYPYLESLDLTQPGTYMQGGVALYNVRMIDRDYPVDVLVAKANERSYQNCDQELLNICFKGKIKFLPPNWNVVVMHPAYIDLFEYWTPKKYYDMYIESRKDPYIIHYSFQQIPCFQSGVDMCGYFWKYARNTTYHEELLDMLMSRRCAELAAGREPPAAAGPSGRYPRFLDKLFPKGSRRRRVVAGIVKRLLGKR